MVMAGDLTLGGEHTVRYTHDILFNYTFVTYIILLTSVTAVSLIKNNEIIKIFLKRKVSEN